MYILILLLSMQAAQDLLEEPKIFSGMPAWFSSSVEESRKNAWSMFLKY